MSLVTNEITSMKNATAQVESQRTPTSTNDSNVFLTLMLKQLENQDPTEPVDNTQWLSQLAQYSSLEQMSEMNKGLTNCLDYINAIYSDMAMNSEITQTLSLIGKDVTVNITDEEGNESKISGVVSEASFEDGTGKIKIGDEYYSITNIVSIREK